MRRFFFALLCVCGIGGGQSLTLVPSAMATLHQTRLVNQVQQRARISMTEYSTKVKMTAETKAPLRQARLFFLYPSTIAGASIASYVSLLRVIGGKDSLADSGNLFVNLGVIAVAVFLARADLKGRAELLEEVAIELGEAEAPSTPDAPSDAADSGS